MIADRCDTLGVRLGSSLRDVMDQILIIRKAVYKVNFSCNHSRAPLACMCMQGFQLSCVRLAQWTKN